MLTTEAVFNIWAPPENPWSPWAKPVLFAHLPIASAAAVPLEKPAEDLSWIPPADGTTALIFDLPGALGVFVGLEAARRGYQPIPLYTALPSPQASTGAPTAACDAHTILSALVAATPSLEGLQLSSNAPPVFLLDADRRSGTGWKAAAGLFDNRTISLTTDFPSASLLLERGVSRVLLVQQFAWRPQPDLAHTLVLWQQAGIAIFACTLVVGAAPSVIHVQPTSRLKVLWERLLGVFGIRPNPFGGIGGILPEGGAGG